MRTSTYGLIVGAALAALGGLPTAAAADDAEICYTQSGNVAMAACSRAIESGRLRGRKLAVTYNNRGEEWKAKRDLSRAMTDYEQAIRIDPQYATAYNGRGSIFYLRGELDRAMADFDQAIKLDPKYANAYYNRGMAREKKNDLRRALADFKRFAQLDPSDPDGPAAVERVTKALKP